MGIGRGGAVPMVLKTDSRFYVKASSLLEVLREPHMLPRIYQDSPDVRQEP